mgnify:CR=1 FL=1
MRTYKKLRGQSYEAESADYYFLISYVTPVAVIEKASGKAFKTARRWSKTTSTHIGEWGRVQSYEREQPLQDWFDLTFLHATLLR